MAAVTQRISNYLSGVSKQTDSKKRPGQVRECINGYPDVTLGLTKRPGFKFIKTLANTSNAEFDQTDLDNAKWFYINRTSTRYIGCVTPKVNSTNGTIHIWNADTGVTCAITDTATSSALGAHAYLNGTSKTNFDVLSVLDSTIITNDTVTVTTQAAPTDFVAASRGTILISTLPEGKSSIQSQPFEIKLGDPVGHSNMGTISPITHTSGASDTYETVLTALKTAIDARSISGLTVTKYSNSLQLDYQPSGTLKPFTLEAKGGADNNRLVVYQDWAKDEGWLPPNSFHNHKVAIVQSTVYENDDYYAKFKADNGAAGSGYWIETIGPSESPGLTPSTMPHRLLNTGTNTFTFGPIPWVERIVGTILNNPHPAFVGKTIKKAFFHDDRLGFLSEDNVITSRAKDPYNFYKKSVRQKEDLGGSIGVNCASVRPTKLHSIKPARQGLVLFSKNQQFLIYADQGPLTNGTTKIRPISNSEMSDTVEPIDVGTHLNFISKTPNFSRVFAMQTKGLGESPQILDIGGVVNEWITADIDTLVASIQNEFIAMSSQSSNTIYFYKTYSNGQEMLMESWFKWTLPGTVQSMSIDQDDMYCVTKQGTGASARYTLEKANLTQSPEVSIITNAQGQKINPCIDLYAQASSVVYDSANDFSKCYLPFANLTDQKNVMIVAGTTAAGTFNNSGFTITPEAVTDGSGTYFKVPGEDLSGNANNVYVGYAYDFDVELPRIYYDLSEEGKQADFTANLTIARCKFDVGLSGVVGFKLNAVGRFASKKEFTGDGSTTQFEWISTDLDYVDRDEVKVKVNNVTTAFTFVNDTKIQFSSAPANNAKIVVYLDEWYNLNPTTEANTYLADDVPLNESSVLTVPIHQRSKNFTLRVFNDSPFPVSLNSMMWEGNYSPRFYKRT